MSRCRKTEYRAAARRAALALLLALPLTVAGFCGARAGGLLDFREPDRKAVAGAALYFRYENSGYVAPEYREIEVKHTESLEKALVAALMAGPLPEDTSFKSPFPPGTEAISVLAEGSRLFVTLSKEFLNPLPNEESRGPAAQEEALTRRGLAIASLVNTLTESGEFSSVQILVLNQQDSGSSLRLNQRYFLEDSDYIPPPFSRQEEAILTPGRALEYILGFWGRQDWAGLARLVVMAPEEVTAGRQAVDLKQLPLLLSFGASTGTISPKGDYALVLADAQMKLDDGRELAKADFPVRLLKRNQAWALSLSSLERLTEVSEP